MTFMLFIAVFFCVALANQNTEALKRAQSCSYVGPSGTVEQIWPAECQSDPDGGLCTSVRGGSCGCSTSYDCFGGTQTPYCPVNNGIFGLCTSCAASDGVPGTISANDDYWCREVRFPSPYLVSSTIGPDFDIPFENVAPIQYYREVCLSDGSCARCDQANGTLGITYPRYTFTSSLSINAAIGTYFCNSIRGPTAGSRAGRPICDSPQLFTDVGLAAKYNNNSLTTTMMVSYASDIGPQALVMNPRVGTPLVSGSTPVPNATLTLPLASWRGSCIPCALADSSPSGDATRIPSFTTPFNSLCSRALPTTPICDNSSTSIGCRACRTNAECFQSATCATDGTGSCTGGNNCMSTGACITCTSNADCLSDGGEVAGQTSCNTATGICVAAFRCGSNFGGTTSPCPTSALPNCNNDGTCIKCTSNSQCGSTDLGTQAVCNIGTGICGGCQVNSDCVGTTGGANCNTGGVCADCTTSGCTNDAGLPSSGTAAQCSGNFCADQNGQTLCNPANRLCENPCVSNQFCSDRAAITTVGGGANCQTSGFCLNCGTAQANSGNCGTLDGPNPSYSAVTGYNGVAGQTTCSATGICVSPFTCKVNSDCSSANGQTGLNCEVDGTCQSCIVTVGSTSLSTNTCGSSDGGETPGQINCLSTTRLCVGQCTTNAGCANTQGNNCMASGLCVTCRSNADCSTSNGNVWGGDGGETPQQTICNVATGICGSACTGNFGTTGSSPCPSTAPNCYASGLCAACTTSADCALNDGPPGQLSSAINTICGPSGICINPFNCGLPGSSSLDNAACSANSGGTANNCNADGTCSSCTSNAQCVANDGGSVAFQPRCNTATGVCVGCQSNNDCSSNAANCQADGSCRDCRLFGTLNNPSGSCASLDGPPGQGVNNINPNCDSLTGKCVDFCTADNQCDDACYPRCQLERGCCVECNTDADCPVAQWRGAETAKTICDTDYDYVCVTPEAFGFVGGDENITCITDDDCGGETPSCSPSQNMCVGCLFDSQCSGSSAGEACDTGSQQCVQCTNDGHCPAGFFCAGTQQCSTLVMYAPAPGSSAGSSLALGLTTVLAILFSFIH